ncbi:MAG: FkbM family methyltransferase [Cyanobacteria bacterium P01_C01_bin.72]
MVTELKPKILLGDYLKHLLIRTPLQEPARKLQDLSQLRRKVQHPEMVEIYRESARIETLLQQIIKPTSNCIDIGCHLGSMLERILKYAPAGNHVAFEPTPYKAQWLRTKFPEVKILEFALGNKPGTATFYQNTNHSGFSGLRPHKKDGDKLLAYQVNCELLDNLIDLEQPVDFMKVDVEGGELGVLRGATKILSSHRPTILFECTQSGLACFKYTAQEVYDFFQAQNYAIFLPKDLLEGGAPLDFTQFEQAMQYPFQAFNFMAQAKV